MAQLVSNRSFSSAPVLTTRFLTQPHPRASATTMPPGATVARTVGGGRSANHLWSSDWNSIQILRSIIGESILSDLSVKLLSGDPKQFGSLQLIPARSLECSPDDFALGVGECADRQASN